MFSQKTAAVCQSYCLCDEKFLNPWIIKQPPDYHQSLSPEILMTRGNSFYHVSTFLWHFDIIFIIVSILIRSRSAKGSPRHRSETIERGSIFYWEYYASLSLFEYTTKGHLFCPRSSLLGWGFNLQPLFKKQKHCRK